MTKHERLALALVVSHGGELRGLELVQTGLLARGQVYVVLDMLEEKGLIASRVETEGRRIYRATDAGRAALWPQSAVPAPQNGTDPK